MSEADLEALFSQIGARNARIGKDAPKQDAFLLHLCSLGKWQHDRTVAPAVTASFSETVHVAYANRILEPTAALRNPDAVD